MSNYYFLFGHDICIIYELEGIDGVISAISKGYDFETYNFNCNRISLSNPCDLLDTYDGWDAYVCITEEEYKQLNKGIPEA